MNSTSSPIPHEEITSRAHQIWVQAGRPEGRDLEHWLLAEQELSRQREKTAQPTEKPAGNGANGSANATAKGPRGQIGRVQGRNGPP